MVWKKKKFFKQFNIKRTVLSFGSKRKIILNKFYDLWKKRFLWSLKDSLKLFKKIRKEEILIESSLILNGNNFLLTENFNFFEVTSDPFLKKWVFSLLKILIKDGKKKKAIYFLKYIIVNLKKKFLDLKIFFLKIKNNMHLPLKMRMRIVAGRKVYIPVILYEDKEIMFILRFIFLSSKLRNEKMFENRILNELFDVFDNKGFSIKKKIQYIKDLKENIPNIRYLNY